MSYIILHDEDNKPTKASYYSTTRLVLLSLSIPHGTPTTIHPSLLPSLSNSPTFRTRQPRQPASRTSRRMVLLRLLFPKLCRSSGTRSARAASARFIRACIHMCLFLAISISIAGIHCPFLRKFFVDMQHIAGMRLCRCHFKCVCVFMYMRE